MASDVKRIQRTTFTVPVSAGPLACTRWATDNPGRPTALLVHGTGFCASVWNAVARDLVADFDVVAFDRRGHGASAKPDDAYEFGDFADDAVALVDALGLDGAYGIGHSAGGTDLLFAAARRPHAFARLFVIEPVAMDPKEPTRGVASAPGPDPAYRERIHHRRVDFPSRQEAVDRLEGRGIYAGWHPDLLDAYVTDGFESLQDGRLTLRCSPAIEGAMLRPIYDAMDGTHPTPPFEFLTDLGCAVLIATTEHSQPCFKRMADVARQLIADATIEHLLGVGHAAPQVAPERVASLARRFWEQAAEQR